jgi:hypothetical protein
MESNSWPRGLRAIFWFAVIGLAVGVAQTLHWILVTNEFFPQPTLQGAYAASALVLGTTGVILGVLGCRRAFAILAFVTCAFHIAVTAYFNLQIVTLWLPDVLASWNIVQPWNGNSWIYVWNCFEITINGFVCYYLLRHEFRVLGCRLPPAPHRSCAN